MTTATGRVPQLVEQEDGSWRFPDAYTPAAIATAVGDAADSAKAASLVVIAAIESARVAALAADNADTAARDAADHLAALQEVEASVDGLLDGRLADPTSAPSIRLTNTFAGKWKANTDYAVGAASTAPNGEIITAKSTHTSGTTYNPLNWNVGTPVGSPVVVKPAGDTRSGVWEYIHNGSGGYLYHLLVGADTTSGSWIAGIGIDAGEGNGFIFRNKAKGIGLKIEQVPSITSPTAYGFAVQQNSALAPAMHLELRGAGVNGDLAPATLLESYSYTNLPGTYLQRWYSYGASAGHVAADTGKLTWFKPIENAGDSIIARSYDSTPAASRKHTQLHSDRGLQFWSPSGTDNLWHGFKVRASGSTLAIQSAPAGSNPDAETYTSLINFAAGRIGFFGAAAVVQPSATPDATDLATAVTLVNALKANLIALGLKVTS